MKKFGEVSGVGLKMSKAKGEVFNVMNKCAERLIGHLG